MKTLRAIVRKEFKALPSRAMQQAKDKQVQARRAAWEREHKTRKVTLAAL